jgi:UDP:flavonoid glycosyltransferase YjiC (YdhE family)
MRIVFSALPAYGHVFPLIPLARALRDAGHEVVFATAEDFLPVVERAGLRGVRVSKPLMATRTSMRGVRTMGGGLTQAECLDRAGRIFGAEVPSEFVADLTPILVEMGPDVVVHDQGNPGAGLAARLAGVSAFNHGFGRAFRGAFADASNGYLRAYAGRLGVQLPDQYAITLGEPTIDICPDSLQRNDFMTLGRRVRLRPTAYAEPGELPGFRRPLAYVTLGTIHGDVDVLRKVIAGLARLEMAVLVGAGPSVDPVDLGVLPKSVQARQWVPQGRLWPYVDVTVHHGGSGEMLGAAAAGVPQLIIPGSVDQPTNARVIVQVGAGLSVAQTEVTADAVAAKVGIIISEESFRAAAERLRAEIAQMPGPADVAAKFPDIVAQFAAN